MADVKVPALLHKMSKAAQKAWYKKNNMAMPDDAGGRSAAAAKKVKVTPRKEIAVEPGSVRALNAARQQAYMAKGGRQPIGAAGSGGHSSMAGSNMSTAKGMIAGIKAGYNPKVSLDPYESEKAKKVGPRSLKLKKESVDLQEVTKSEAESMLGGPVKEKPKMPPGKQPAGYRYVRNLARKAMKKGMKEEVEVVEAVKDAADIGEYDYEGDMAKSQLRSIMANSKRMHDMLEENTNLPEWVQSKITLAEDYISTASNYMQGEMNEEVEQIDEKMNLVKAKMGDVVKDFYKSKAPQFKGKSMAKRREMAVAAKLGAEREAGMREEVEQIDEQSPAEIKAKYYHDQFNKVKPVKAYDTEGKLVGRYRSMDHAKQMKPGHTYKVEEEVVTEAEGKVAVTPKEKALAVHHGDKTRITYGDVIKARLKSAAAKKMGK